MQECCASRQTASKCWFRRLHNRLGALDQRGSAAIEAAFALPVIFLLTFGIIELSRLAYTQGVLFYAAAETTRFAIVRDGKVTAADLATYAKQKMIGFNSMPAVITIEDPLDPMTSTRKYTVRIQYDFNFIAPIIIDTVTLSASSSGFLAFPF